MMAQPASRSRALNRRAKRRPVRPLTSHFERLETRAMLAIDLLQLDSQNYADDHFLVQLREGPALTAQSSTQTNHLAIGQPLAGASIARQVSTDGWYQVSLQAGTSLSAALQAYSAHPDVVVAAPDFRVAVTGTPNDPSFATQWALENTGRTGSVDADIDAAQAWDFGTATSVVVAVIDTGIDYNHIDLAGNIWTNPREVAGNGIDDDRNGYIDDTRGWNFADGNNDPMDDNGHGTHVAGTIGAVGNNGVGVSGVAWQAKLMALKFLDASGSGNLSDAVAAIDYARVNGAKIINASWGGGGFSSMLQSAIARFQNAGGIFVAAAGNESLNNALTGSYPANYPNVISVAASTSSDVLAAFSNFGTNVDIAAPGQSILSTIPGNRYASYSGTSMASPHVAGALALLWGQAPAVTAAALVDAVLANTDSILLTSTQHGRLNVGKAAAALAGRGGAADTISPTVTASVFNITASGLSSIDVTFSEPVLASTMIPAAFALTGPSGAIPISGVTQVTSTVWRVQFAAQSTAGLYTIVVLPTVTDAAGNRLNQDGDSIAGETLQDRYTATFTLPPSTVRTYTRTGPIALQDATYFRVGTTTASIDVPDSLVISDLNVILSIDHSYTSDLRIRLIGPDGTSVLLVNRRGGSSANLRLTLDDEASASLLSLGTNLTGAARPERPLSALDGKNAAGRWTLEVIDAARIDSGRINSIQLQFSGAGGGTGSAAASGPVANNSGTWAGLANAMLQDWLRRLRGATT